MSFRWVTVLVAVLAFSAHVALAPRTAVGVGFALWAAVPYAAVVVGYGLTRSLRSGVVALMVALGVHLVVVRETFIAPSSSTGSLLLLFGPFWTVFVLVPAAFAVPVIARALAGRSKRAPPTPPGDPPP